MNRESDLVDKAGRCCNDKAGGAGPRIASVGCFPMRGLLACIYFSLAFMDHRDQSTPWASAMLQFIDADRAPSRQAAA